MPARPDAPALGLIETRGYVGLIAATDAAVKAGNVEVRSVERASGGLVLVTLVGDVASVQVAVQAGTEAVAAVGHLVSSHVIPRPDPGVWQIIGVRHGVGAAGRASDQAQQRGTGADELEALPVRELRRRARATAGISLTGREISRASKQELLAALRRASPSNSR